jgi:hypothetical protein
MFEEVTTVEKTANKVREELLTVGLKCTVSWDMTSCGQLDDDISQECTASIFRVVV